MRIRKEEDKLMNQWYPTNFLTSMANCSLWWPVAASRNSVNLNVNESVTNEVLFIAGLVAYWPARIQDGTARPILSSRDFWQASSVLQLKAFYF